jgi:hypothetical protein
VGFLLPPDRPLGRLITLASSSQERQSSRPHRTPCIWLPEADTAYAPGTGRPTHPPALDAGNTALDAAVRLLTQLLGATPAARPGAIRDLEPALDPAFVLWSPRLRTSSRAETMEALLQDDDDTLTERAVVIEGADASPPRLYLEWRLSGRFANPCFIDDDVLIEPTGRLVTLAGLLVLEVRDTTLVEAHCYFDDLALLEQLLATDDPRDLPLTGG